jgi:hypothetical protein
MNYKHETEATKICEQANSSFQGIAYVNTHTHAFIILECYEFVYKTNEICWYSSSIEIRD